MANVFKRGHCIRLDVTSSSFPRFSRNLNTGEDVGTGTRMQVAHQTVLHTSAYPSRVVLPVIPPRDLRATLPDLRGRGAAPGVASARESRPCRSTARPRLRSPPTSSTRSRRARAADEDAAGARSRPRSASARDGARADDGAQRRPGVRDPRHERRHAGARRVLSGRCSSRATRSSCRRRASSSAGRFAPPAASRSTCQGSAADGWRWDLDAIEQAIGTRTRALLLCNPGNPTGYVTVAARTSPRAVVTRRAARPRRRHRRGLRGVALGRRAASPPPSGSVTT